MLRRMKKISAVFLIAMLLATTMGMAAASAETALPAADTDPYVFTHDSVTKYWHRSPHRINNGTTPAMYHLTTPDGAGGTQSLAAYCCDIETSISAGTRYKRLNLEDAGYYTADSAKHIRYILANGYWIGRDNLALLAAAAGAEGLTAAEALSATQAAIWSYANVESISDVYAYTGVVDSSSIKDTSAVNPSEAASYGGENNQDNLSEARILAVYNYLRGGTLENTSVVANFTGEQVVLTMLSDLNSYDVTVRFGLKGSFSNAGNLSLTAVLKNSGGILDTRTFDLLGGGSGALLTADADGLFTVTFPAVALDALTSGAYIELEIDGTQYVSEGVYFYEPEGGRKSAQCFVGYGSGETPIYAQSGVSVEVGTADLSLVKYDGDAEITVQPMAPAEGDAAGEAAPAQVPVQTGPSWQPIPGVEFALYVQIGDKPAVPYPGAANKVTDAQGQISWNGLVTADNIRYFAKETVPQAGYRPEGAAQLIGLVGGQTAEVYNYRGLGTLFIEKELTGDAVNRHFDFLVELDYGTAYLNNAALNWINLDAEYGVLDARYTEVCEEPATPAADQAPAEGEAPAEPAAEGDVPAEPAEPEVPKLSAAEHPEKIVLQKNGNGKFTAVIPLAGGESVMLSGIPAGASYVVTELGPDGLPLEDYQMVNYDGQLIAAEDAQMSGIIPMDSVPGNLPQNLEFINSRYGSGMLVLEGTKLLDGKASAVPFEFVLTELFADGSSRQLQKVKNGEDGIFRFEPVSYEAPGIYTYTIHEVLKNGYICDDNIYTVEVEVTRNDVTRMLDVSAPVIKSRAAAEAERQQLIKDAEAALADYIASLEAEGKEIPEGLNADQFMANPNPDAAVVNAVSFENETITYYGGWTSLAVKKVWVLDDGGEAADSVTVNLLRNGKVYETLSLSAADGWSKTWSLLDDSYTWTVEEVDVPEGFTSAISRSGLTFTIVNDDKDGGGNDENGGNDGNGGTGGDGGGERSGGDGGQNQDRGDGGEELVIIEEDVPLANVPRTGSNLTSELICIASGLALAVLLLAGKRKRTE